MGTSRGILYVVVGESSYLDEALVSANSARRAMPDVSLTVATDHDITHGHPFNSIIRLEPGSDGYRAKIETIMKAPYDRTLYLDTDTYVTRDLAGLFDLLDRFDVAAAHAPIRVTDARVELPDAFPVFNTGVIAFRREAMGELATWLDLYDKMGFASSVGFDQEPFRLAVYKSSLRIATLPPEFNCRFPLMAGYYNLPAAILHDHVTEAEFKQAANVLAAKRHDFWQGVYMDRQVWGKVLGLQDSSSRQLDLRPPEMRRSSSSDEERLAQRHADRIAELERALELRDADLSRHRAWVQSMQLSASWRLTAPLRRAKRKARRLRAVRRHTYSG